jgi:hypothetical protein
MRAISAYAGFKLAFRVAHRPEANGLAERPHRFLNSYLFMLTADRQDDWESGISDQYIACAAFAYGFCHHPAKQETPHYLEYRRDLRPPSQLEYDPGMRDYSRDPKQYVQELQRHLFQARE